MTEQELVSLVNSLFVSANHPKGLSDIQSLVLRGVWQGNSYQQIARELGYDSDYIRQVGARLWHLISDLTGQQVYKSNLRTVFENYRDCAARSASDRLNKIPSPLDKASNIISLPPLIEDREIRWVGRSTLVEELTQTILERSRILILVGITGIGKSSLAMRLTLEPILQQHWSSVNVVRLDAESNNFIQLARQVLGEQIVQNLESPANSSQLIAAICDRLQAHPCVLIIDMLEEILQSDAKGKCAYLEPLFGQLFDRLLQVGEMRSRIILTSQIQPPAIAEGRFANRSHAVRLSGLEESEAMELFDVWDVNPTSDLELTYLYRTIQVYEGHPLALRVVAGEIREPPYFGDIKAYWHDYGAEIETAEKYKERSRTISGEDKIGLTDYSVALTDLVKQRIEKAFSKLKQSAPLSYLLLCMGSVYRCAVDRSAWLILIADLSSDRQVSAFQTLQRRFLLEQEYSGGKVSYRLHSLIRAVALQHLNDLEPESLN